MKNAKRDDLKYELRSELNNNQKFIDSINKSSKQELNLDDVDIIIDTFLNSIIKLTDQHDELALHGFGSFKAVIRNQRKCRNFDGEEILVEAKRVPKFKAGKNFNDKVSR